MYACSPLRLAIARNGAGSHPAAWREPEARPAELLSAGYWAGLVREADRGLLDFVTIEDGLGVRAEPRPGHDGDPAGRTDLVRGHLDAVLIASRVGTLTRHVGRGSPSSWPWPWCAASSRAGSRCCGRLARPAGSSCVTSWWTSGYAAGG
jgi:alkanesulfonate monooxygenase SsuD/methylene tetrahydromethanopterin reductase-like flavin-dependent oxidoreductase (luciferase family)